MKSERRYIGVAIGFSLMLAGAILMYLYETLFFFLLSFMGAAVMVLGIAFRSHMRRSNTVGELIRDDSGSLSAEGESKTARKAPGLDEESSSQGGALDTDLESSDFDIQIEDESGSAVVNFDDEEPVVSADDEECIAEANEECIAEAEVAYAIDDADLESSSAPQRLANERPQVDENVQFTVYRPKVVQPRIWYDLLAFAHLSTKAADADADEPDPVEEVHRQARQVLSDTARDYQNLAVDALQTVPRKGQITFLPEVRGIEFNPQRCTFVWQESVHRQVFRLRATSLGDWTARGKLSIFQGAILLADVPLKIEVASKPKAEKAKEALHPISARRYRKIFASYSHKDLPIVEQFEAFAATLGDEYLRDWKHLRAGEVWSEKLRKLIEQADIFQLFWSRNSMRSDFVRQEWEYALKLAATRPNFIRPTYWEDPMPTSKIPPLPPDSLARLHFQRLGKIQTPTKTDEEFDVVVAKKKIIRKCASDEAEEEFAPPRKTKLGKSNEPPSKAGAKEQVKVKKKSAAVLNEYIAPSTRHYRRQTGLGAAVIYLLIALVAITGIGLLGYVLAKPFLNM